MDCWSRRWTSYSRRTSQHIIFCYFRSIFDLAESLSHCANLFHSHTMQSNSTQNKKETLAVYQRGKVHTRAHNKATAMTQSAAAVGQSIGQLLVNNLYRLIGAAGSFVSTSFGTGLARRLTFTRTTSTKGRPHQLHTEHIVLQFIIPSALKTNRKVAAATPNCPHLLEYL